MLEWFLKDHDTEDWNNDWKKNCFTLINYVLKYNEIKKKSFFNQINVALLSTGDFQFKK